MAKIKYWLIRGDCHGWFGWIDNQLKNYPRKETAVIILGDAGFNFYLNKSDIRTKREVDSKSYYIYCVHGNHEMRPQNLDFAVEEWDDNVGGYIYYEAEFPHIRYFKDYGIYTINGYRCLVVGGAYSVDKWWRLQRAGIADTHNPNYTNPKKTGWFFDEQLTTQEMADCEQMITASGNNTFDFIFTHTCPKKFQPSDLFLKAVNQSDVDNSMEVWMDNLSEKIVVNFAWCFGHYHADRLERPHVEQYYNDIEQLDVIADRWKKFNEDEASLDWWLVKSPNFYMR